MAEITREKIEDLVLQVRELVKHINKDHVAQTLVSAAVAEVVDMKPCKHAACFLNSVAILHQIIDLQAALSIKVHNMLSDGEDAPIVKEFLIGLINDRLEKKGPFQ